MGMVLKKGTDKKSIEAVFAKLMNRKRKSKGISAFKYCGIIKLDKDALSIQKDLRSEWD